MNEQLAILNKTAHSSVRLFVSKKVIARRDKEFGVLNALSVWRGCDKEDPRYFSWEFISGLEENLIELARTINTRKKVGGLLNETEGVRHYDYAFTEGFNPIVPTRVR